MTDLLKEWINRLKSIFNEHRIKIGDKDSDELLSLLEELQQWRSGEKRYTSNNITLCKSCNCMTHTAYKLDDGHLIVERVCGKCGGTK